MKLLIKGVRSTGHFTEIILQDGYNIKLRPFIYVKKGDFLEFLPSIKKFQEVYKIFDDKATSELKKIKIHPPYCTKETIYLGAHRFNVIFRERINSNDWKKIKELEKFHYRGKGLNKLVGRRTVLLAEMKDHGVIGFGVISATVAVAKPRFELLQTNFTDQMKTKLINRIVRIPRIVIHPEFRGINLGVLMAKHLVLYAKKYWDINHYTPIMVEVIAAMTEYHKFFEKAGFIKIGYTSGYKNGIIPIYGNGSFESRNYESYDFMENQNPKPYLVFPLNKELKQKIRLYFPKKQKMILHKHPKLKHSIKFENVSVSYKIRNGSTKRTEVIKEVFGVDAQHAFSPILTNFSLEIEPGDVVLITGASGSGKSTILRLLTEKNTTLKKEMEIRGKIINKSLKDIAILDTKWSNSLPLIDQIGKNKDIKEAIKLLNSVGLSEAHLYIKKPNQLSDGQRYRFAVAKLCDSNKAIWIADEFVSTLNSEMAAIVAKGLRKVAYKHGATLILAAPHIHNFIHLLLPNKLIKLKWGTKPIIYSIKIINFYQNGDKISLSILNNGHVPLTNVQVGTIIRNGFFLSQNNFKQINPKDEICCEIKIRNSEYYALGIKTNEGVGEILYLEIINKK
ncbi:ABC transporter ATP-binding protein [Candidatus Desulfofervidus auxilii]|uniref:ABC transporter ATP-binding protein n=1 Tax=Desulfofervidus auxilii TaxID=1621989 RepID=A0A7U4QIN9_DESA2|nr:ATP-binding cassette domain-containing protein [Candidatus Desulfofervidus auxilii]AMM40025.1 ABC transporter ATP-binding protein [Candidatus Desulfofervidus auxilii]CAD7769894.1 ABC transporter [Candidatus Methanoperedenaceae archaeon GB50]CAD7770907.1 ABC transporter [Candidatus Methanoperedenaceae archaeon GB37]